MKDTIKIGKDTYKKVAQGDTNEGGSLGSYVKIEIKENKKKKSKK